MITVLAWLWHQAEGRTQFNATHVNVWAAMVRRHLETPCRIACVTDLRSGIDPSTEIITPPHEFDDVRIPSWGPARPQCLRRISMFGPKAAEIFGERFICMDLDCVVTGPLDPLFARDDDFVICPGTVRTRAYNGSMMMLRAGTRTQVYDRFTPEAAALAGQAHVGSDQAWITSVLGGGEATWRTGVGYWQGSGVQDQSSAVTFFPGHDKPWHLIDRGHEWVETHYRADRDGWCLVLGHHPSVWQDAEVALAGGQPQAVIASPEAAQHWPGPIDAVARDDAHALRLARMLGFEADHIVFCGKQLGKARK
jgi:hypothetical protein